MNRASIGAISFAGSVIGCPVSRANTSAYASRSRCTTAGSSTVSLTGLSSAIALSFSFAMFFSSSLVRLQHEILVDDDAHRKSRPNRQGRLNIEILLNDFLAGLVEAIARSAAKR